MLTYIAQLLLFIPLDSSRAETNIALNKPAKSSSVWTLSMVAGCQFTASRAVDGDYGVNMDYCQCAATADAGGMPNWMSFDMQGLYYVDYVVVLNRDQQPQRLDYFVVGLSNDYSTYINPIRGSYPLCGQYPAKVQISTMYTLRCNPFLPKQTYLIIQQPVNADGYLTLCELEIYPTDLYPGTPPIIWSKQFLDVPVMTYNVMLLDNVMYKTKRSTALQCVVLCSVQPSKVCDSINYCRSSGVCQLNSHKYGYSRSSIVNVADATCFWMVPKYASFV